MGQPPKRTQEELKVYFGSYESAPPLLTRIIAVGVCGHAAAIELPDGYDFGQDLTAMIAARDVSTISRNLSAMEAKPRREEPDKCRTEKRQRNFAFLYSADVLPLIQKY